MADLRAQLERVADLSDEVTMDDAAAVRQRGDRRRRRNRLTTVAVVIAVVFAGTAMTYQAVGQSGSVPADGLERDTTSVRRITMPHAGMLSFGAGSLWVVDEGDGSVSLSEGPDGSLVQFDPASGNLVGVVPHAIGGWPVFGDGALWLSTQRMDQLTRVDLETKEVRRHVTSVLTPGLATLQVANGSVWVANINAGTVGQLDAGTLRLLKEIPVNGSPIASATDGRHVWFSLAAAGGLVSVDTASGTVVSTVPVGSTTIRALAIDGSSLYASDDSTVYEVDVSRAGSERVVSSRPLGGSEERSGPGAASMYFGEGYLWVLRTRPNELLRIDPDTLTVSRRTTLSSDPDAEAPIAVTAGQGRVWVSLPGEVVELDAD